MSPITRLVDQLQASVTLAGLTAPPRYVGPKPRRGEPPPADTRSLTARVLGDPLPGRSALDMRRAG